MTRQELIQTALGERPPDLVLKNARVVNVFTAQTQLADVAVRGGVIAGVGRYSGGETVDLAGKYLAPGFINAHCHIESSMVTPPVYCAQELRWGTTALIADPHEIVNVAGAQGMRFMLRQTKRLPVDVFLQTPSCVPSTPFEHSGCAFTAEEMAAFLDEPRVLGLGEMMNYPGVFACDAGVMEKLELFQGRVIDGHAPGVRGKQLQAYRAAGILTDHESITYEEAREKLAAGIAVLVREGSASRNLGDILPGMLRDGIDTANMAFCTDDKHLAHIAREGTVRHALRLAVALGMKPETALQMATVNAARIFGLPGRGAVAPGYLADLVVLEDLADFHVLAVYKNGVLAVREGEMILPDAQPPLDNLDRLLLQTVKIAPLEPETFALPCREHWPIVGILPGQIATKLDWMPPQEAMAALENGRLCKLAVLERHRATGNAGVGLLAGYGLKNGAIATTVAHDSHNMIVVGDRDRDMALAAEELLRVQGGYTIVSGGKIVDTLPLPVAGLMSTLPAGELTRRLDAMIAAARGLGVARGIDPFTTLSFMALPVIPEVRVTDMGVFDVTRFQFL